MLRESRRIAKLLLKGADEEAWQQALYIDNILQKKVPATARRMARLIRNRLELMTPELWKMVVDGGVETATQALLAAAIKHSRLLGDFLDEIAREHYRLFDKQLSINDWNRFMAEREHRDVSISKWSPSTRAKLGQVVFRILAEAKYIDSTRSLHLVPAAVVSEVSNYLSKHKETYVLRCMNVT